MDATALRSGKSHRDENFPVASRLIRPEHRRPIRAFYEFVRTADDVADHPRLPAEEKLAALDQLEASLLGQSAEEPTGVALREALADADLSAVHARELLTAFRLDVTKSRYRDWDDLVGYCRYSAMPVGRFVLDVHGEAESTWAAADALCTALQIINHLQDCADDYRNLDRVYIPLDILSAHGANVDHLARPSASPELRTTIDDMCRRTAALLLESESLARQVRQTRLSLEISVIQRLAQRLVRSLRQHDPLSERAELGSFEVARTALFGLLGAASHRITHAPLHLLRHRSEALSTANNGHNGRASASGSSFYAAMRILPRERRSAIFDIYGFCRAVDDIADEPGEHADRLEQLDQWRNDIVATCDGRPPAHLAGLSEAVDRFHLKRDDFLAVIDGMQMDVDARMRGPDLATLDLYCDRVASAVGRLCVRVFGMEEQEGIDLAYHLGRALQLTNILRDLDEDGAIGRVYLPREFLEQAGITATEPEAILRHPALPRACELLASRAAEHFQKADAVMQSARRTEVRCPRIMAEAYRGILRQLRDRGWDAPRTGVHLGKSQIARIVLRSYVG